MPSAIKIFCCYARKDQQLLYQLRTHLIPLQREGLINLWHDGDISAGTEWDSEISKHLNEAQIILLLVSPDFMASEYCYSKEMSTAMGRHRRGVAVVIPVILRPVYWQGSPFGKLQVLPKNAKPIQSSNWFSIDEALYDVAEGIYSAAQSFIKKPPISLNKTAKQVSKPNFVKSPPFNTQKSSEFQNRYPKLRKQLAELLSMILGEPGKVILTDTLANDINAMFGKELPDTMLVKELLLTREKSLHWHPLKRDSYIYTAYDGTEYIIQKSVVHAINQSLGKVDESQYQTVGLIRDTDEKILDTNVPALGRQSVRFMQKAFARNEL